MIEDPYPPNPGTAHYVFHRSARQILPQIRQRLTERGLPELLAEPVADLADVAGFLTVDAAIDAITPLLKVDDEETS